MDTAHSKGNTVCFHIDSFSLVTYNKKNSSFNTIIITRQEYKGGTTSIGYHGYENTLTDMRAIFRATGPGN